MINEEHVWLGNRSTELLPWDETVAMFKRRDELRRAAWTEMLKRTQHRVRLLKLASGERIPRGLLAIARRNPSARDAPLITFIDASQSHAFYEHVEEVCASRRAPVSERRIRRASQAVMRMEHKIIAANMSLCLYEARRWINNSIPLEDLIQEAAIGLQTAVQRFDVGLGNKFSTYSMWWIKHCIRRIVANDATVRVPVHVHTTLAKIKKLRRQGLDDDAIASKMKVPLKKVQSALDVQRGMHPPQSIDTPLFEGRPLHEFLPGPSELDDVEDLMSDQWRMQLVAEVVEGLPYRERYVLGERAKGRTLASIGEDMELSRERVRQLERGAMDAVRERIRLDYPELFDG